MSAIESLGLGSPENPVRADRPSAMFSEAQVVARILRFTGYTIDDVINDPIARNTVRGYYGLHRCVEKRCAELDELSAR